MDPELADGPLLSVRVVPARAFEPLVERLKTTVRGDGTIIVEPDLERDRLLADYRRQFTEQVVHDLSYNLQHLWTWAKEIGSSQARVPAVLRDGRIQDGIRRLNKLRQFAMSNDGWSGNRLERECGTCVQQFYFDALALADRLLDLELGRTLRRRRSRRLEISGAASSRPAQALANVVDLVIPGMPGMRPLRALLPAVTYHATRLALPWAPCRYADWLTKVRRISNSGALGSIGSPGRDVVERHGIDDFCRDRFFFDQATGKTRQNIILAFSHRHSLYDHIVIAESLGALDHAVWGNGQYFPRSAARDRRFVLVYPSQKKSLDGALAKSAELVLHQRVPLLIAVDGGIPYLCYGQQMRVKRGIRLLIDYLKAADSSRRTYIVPVSFDDTASFIRGLDPCIRVTAHPPICVDDIAQPQSPPDRERVNWGDPLLTYLECLFLTNTGQIRHGWHTPPVIETVRRVRREIRNHRSLRNSLRGLFHASLYDLSRDRPQRAGRAHRPAEGHR